MKKPLLIIGVDPGTTLAYAVLDLDGNVVRVSSSKQLDINSLTANVFYLGKPLIVATDVNPVPQAVDKFASQTGAKVIGPEESLKVLQKKELTKGYDFANDHERDALVAAIFAFKKIRALLNKINLYVQRHGKEFLKRDVVQIVVLKGISISDAIAILEKKEVKPKVRKPRMRTEPIKVKFDEVKYLQKQNEDLKSKIRYLESKLKHLRFNINRISDKKIKNLIGFREKKVSFLNKELGDYKTEIQKLENKLSSLNNLLLNIDKFLVVPRFKNLSLYEISNKELKDVIFVEDPSTFSEKALDALKGKVGIIIYSKPVGKDLRKRFIFINIQNLEAVFEDKFILVSKAKFEEEKNNFDILSKVLEEYKEERVIS